MVVETGVVVGVGFREGVGLGVIAVVGTGVKTAPAGVVGCGCSIFVGTGGMAVGTRFCINSGN